MDERLYINSKLIHLPERSVSRTLQINDFRETKDRQANYSNSIKIPKTASNVEIFESLGMVGIQNRLPYEKVSVKYVLNGIQLISDGKGIIKNTNEFYNLVVYDGNISMNDLLGVQTLQDLDFNLGAYRYNHTLTSFLFFNSFENTSGYVYCLKGLGGITSLQNTIPSFYIHTLFEMIFVQKGWQIVGDIFSNADYLSRIQTMDIGFENTVVGSIVNISGYPLTVNENENGDVNLEINRTTLNVTTNGLHSISLTGTITVNAGDVTVRIKKTEPS